MRKIYNGLLYDTKKSSLVLEVEDDGSAMIICLWVTENRRFFKTKNGMFSAALTEKEAMNFAENYMTVKEYTRHFKLENA